MKRSILLATAFWVLTLYFPDPLPAADEAYLNDVYEGALLTLREGDRARENFNFAASASLYETSLWTLQTLRREYPKWKTSDVRGEIDRCLRGIRELPAKYRDRFEPSPAPEGREHPPEKAPPPEEAVAQPETRGVAERFEGVDARRPEEKAEAAAPARHKPAGKGSFLPLLLYGAVIVLSAAALAFIFFVFLRRR